MVCICQPETRETLGDDEEERPTKYLIDFQEEINESSCFQEGNEKRSVGDIVDCQEGRT
jgi:hypothetical protein